MHATTITEMYYTVLHVLVEFLNVTTIMDDFLDLAVEGNIRLLPDLLRSLRKEEKALRGQVCKTDYRTDFESCKE